MLQKILTRMEFFGAGGKDTEEVLGWASGKLYVTFYVICIALSCWPGTRSIVDHTPYLLLSCHAGAKYEIKKPALFGKS